MTARRVLVMLTVLLGTLGILVGPSARPAYACSCAGLPGMEHYRRADAVFTGVALEYLDTNPDGPIFSSADPIVWTFEVEIVRKGRVPDTVDVVTARFESSCGYAFEGGERYEVFARLEDEELWTGLCSGTRSLAAGEGAFRLRESPREGGGATIGEPGPPPPGLGSLVLPLGSLVVAFASVLVGIGYHHRRRPSA